MEAISFRVSPNVPALLGKIFYNRGRDLGSSQHGRFQQGSQ